MFNTEESFWKKRNIKQNFGLRVKQERALWNLNAYSSQEEVKDFEKIT